MRSARRHGVWSGLVALLCAALFVGCENTGITQLEVTIDSDLSVPAELDRLVIEVLGVRTSTAEADLAQTGLPRTIGLYHSTGPLGPFSVKASGFKGSLLIVEKTVEASFVRDQTSSLLIRLDRICQNLLCPQGQTCEQGVCREVGPAEDGGVSNVDGGAQLDAGAPPDAGPGVCPVGYVGTDAASCKDLDECKAGDACDPLTQCVNREGSYECTACPYGYGGDPKLGCESVDECLAGTDQCDPFHPCTNTASGYVCGDCPMGYTGDGRDGCKDIDECAANACDSLTACTNTAGGFKCSACPPGYLGAGKTSCVDVDECVANSDACDALTQCVNRSGGYQCTDCPAGYSGEGLTGCTNIDECAVPPSPCGSLPCADTTGGYLCGDCAAGYIGASTGACEDVDECALSGACDPLSTCENTAGSFTCTACPAGYTGGGETSCVDIDECAGATSLCDALTDCFNQPGGFQCTACPSGYTGNGLSGCVNIDECAEETDLCDSLSDCRDIPGSYRCGDCPSGYTGDGAGGCKDLDECATDDACDALTVCSNSQGGFTCSACPEGYTGSGQTSCADVDECAGGQDDCDPLTLCVNKKGGYSCTACPSGYTGEGLTGCQNVDECASPGTCPALTQCVDTTGSYACLPSIRVADASSQEGNAGTKSLSFEVILSAASTETVTVHYATADATATAAGSAATGGTDYETASGTLTFAPGELTKTLGIPIRGDKLNEADESFVLTLSNASNANFADNQALGVVENDDAVPGVSIGDVSLDEGHAGTKTLSFPVTLSAASGRQVTFAFATSDGTARAAGAASTGGADYVAQSGTLTFAPGETDKTLSVVVRGDTLHESDETLLVTLSNPGNVSFSDEQATGTIVNDDALPSLSIADATTTEGNAGNRTLSFVVTLSSPSGQSVTVDYATSDGTAVTGGALGTGGSDYVGQTGILSLAAGETSRAVDITIHGDALHEANETFVVALSGALNAAVSDGQGVGTIQNDDATPTLSIGDASALEGETGQSLLSFTVTLSAASGREVSVQYATADGTATTTGALITGGADYEGKSGTLVFAPGDTTRTLDVAIHGDALTESNQTFLVNLTAATNATIADSQAVGTIENDDNTPSWSIADASIAEGDSGQTVLSFTVTLAAPAGQTVSVQYATANGTATSSGVTGTGGADYVAKSGTITFAAGVTSQTLDIVLNGDTLEEDDETFVVNLSAPSVSSTIADGQASGVIENDDAQPTLSIGDTSDFEGNSGLSTFTFVVTLSSASSRTVTVRCATSDFTAAGNDYVSQSSTLTFAPGDTSQLFSVKVKGDQNIESDETFFVNLSSPSNATIADAQGVGTIKNND